MINNHKSVRWRRIFGCNLLFIIFTLPLTAQQLLVTGKVTDGQLPISGANVIIKNTTNGVVTDFDGRYTITARSTDTLQISYLGYTTLTIPVQNRTIINISLQEDATALSEVRINAGYYTTTDRERTGSISRITAKDIENQVILNPIASLKGRMTGVHVVESSGLPGSGFNLIIRGKNSIAAGTEPLYIIDGVPFSSQSLSSKDVSARTIPGADFSPFSFLNPSDIQSIEVLKDADATAIYGSRGANGVVLITTKTQHVSKTTYNFSVKSGLGRNTKQQKLLNTAQYLQMREQAFANDGITNYPANAYDINGTWDRNRYTDWQKELLGGTASFKDYQMAVSGGNSNTSFFVNGGYRYESPISLENDNYKRANGLAKILHNSPNGKFNFSLSTLYSHEDNDLPEIDLSYQALILPPNAPRLYNDDGSLNWENGTFNNPLADLEGDLRSKRNSLLVNAQMEIKLLDKLSLKTNLGYQDTKLSEFRTYPHTRFPPQYGLTSDDISAIYTNNGSRNSWIIEPQLNYSHQWNKNKLELLVGYSAQNETSETFSQYAERFASNAQLMNLAAAKTIKVTNDSEQFYKYQALFGRINYNYDGKYMINITGRRDGSSRFGSNNRFANFGAIGAAWLFSEENRLKILHSILSYGKLRASYGTTGNDQIGDYRYLNSYISSGTSYNGTIGLAPSALYNPNLGWEENRKVEMAVELGFLNNRIHPTINYYRNRSSNQLVEIPLPATAGFSSILSNLDALVENSGLEITLNTINLEKGKWTWNSSFNLTLPKNKLIRFPNLESSTYSNSYVIGKPITIKKTLNYTGVDPQTGVYSFQDFNEDGKISIPEDGQHIIDTAPKFYGGLSNTITYGNLALDVFFNFNKQMVFNSNIFATAPGIMGNKPVDVLDAWTKPGDQANIQAYTTGTHYERLLAPLNLRESNAVYNDVFYLRLNNISLTYNLENIISESSNAKIFIQGQNLLTITNLKDQDPEKTQGFTPPLRWISLGFALTF